MAKKKIVVGQINYRKQIRRQARKLADLLLRSPEYTQFTSAKKILEEDGINAMALAELRQQQMEHRMSSILGTELPEEAIELDKEYVTLIQEPSVRDYLFAEGRFLNLIADVEEVFGKKLDLWQPVDEEQPRARYDIRLN